MTTSSSQTSTALPADLAAFCARSLAAWNDHDAGAMADLLTEDVVWEDPALPGPAHGIPAVQAFMREAWVGFPDLRFDESDTPHRTAGGDQVAWRWRMRGTNTGPIDPPGFAPTGRKIEIEGVDLWTMRDGRIAVYRAFYDFNALAVQLGLAPGPGSRAQKAAVRLQRAGAAVKHRLGK
jgi:steroid delta-isomerase-like uncharacterized protein